MALSVESVLKMEMDRIDDENSGVDGKPHDLRGILRSVVRASTTKSGVGQAEKLCIKAIVRLISIYVRLRLGIIHSSKSRELSRKDRSYEVYTNIAAAFERKHRLSTNGRDVWWRREVGFDVANFLNAKRQRHDTTLPILLDIGTGIGLSVEEMLRVFTVADTRVRAIGMDVNEAILVQANDTVLPRIRRDGLTATGLREVEFVCADATDLLGTTDRPANAISFETNSVACTTNIFAVGGIAQPLQSLKQQLAVLKPGGLLVMFDIHRPIPELAGLWPLSHRRRWPAFEQFAWDEVTVPLVLQELWAWEDPTFYFYTLPLLTHFEPASLTHFGFDLLSHQIRTEPWWFGMPVMTIGKILVKKVEISQRQSLKCEETLEGLQKLYTPTSKL
jgi:SAM-dependent methyltransferase